MHIQYIKKVENHRKVREAERDQKVEEIRTKLCEVKTSKIWTITTTIIK